jgi:transposase-like protein
LPHEVCPHDRGGLRDEWKCPGCDRTYSLEDYARAVSHAHYAFADFLTLDDASARTGVKPGTIKVWANRGKVAKKRDRDSGRMTYRVADIEARHAEPEEVA